MNHGEPSGPADEAPRRGSQQPTSRPGRLAAATSRLLIRCRWLVVFGWAAAAAAATVYLPALGQTGGGQFGGLVSRNDPAVKAEAASVAKFAFPVLSRTVVVQRDRKGLSGVAQARSVARALAFDVQARKEPSQVLGALPLVNNKRLFPGAREHGTTAITYLFMNPSLSFRHQDRLARQWARRYVNRPGDHLTGVTGLVPGRVAQADIISASLPRVEAAAVVAVVLLVAFSFRSLTAPAVLLAAAAVSYLLVVRVTGTLGALLGLPAPGDLEPLVIALLLGVTTDYSIFYLSGLRFHLYRGRAATDAARSCVAEQTPIVAVAGLTVAAGTGSLLAARSPFFRAFGPALAGTVIICMAVATTLIPALLAIAGRRAYWPSHPAGSPAPGSPAPGQEDRAAPVPPRGRARFVRLLVHKPVAGLVAVGCVAGLTLAATPVRHLDLGMSVIRSLPPGTTVARAARAARQGFAAGILSPVVVIAQKPRLTRQRPALDRLQRQMEHLPGVAAVTGPAHNPLPTAAGAVLSRGGDAARYVIVLNVDPLGARGIGWLTMLRSRMPHLLARAGLHNVMVSYAGDTAIAASMAGRTQRELTRISITAGLVILALLVIFLRALIAPLYLLATTALGVLASLGLTVLVFQQGLGHDGLTFYVPFAAAVLLVSFGSDYDILGVGRIWETARTLPLTAAIVQSVPRTSRAITVAGLTLAISFGLLVLIPLRPFRELAFAIFTGVLIDALLIRTLLVPALLVLAGRFSAWPSRLHR